jgi:hypothetical protein
MIVKKNCAGCGDIFYHERKRKRRKYCSSKCFYKHGNAFGNKEDNPGSKVAAENRKNLCEVKCSVCSKSIFVKASLAPKLKTCGEDLCKKTYKANVAGEMSNGRFKSGTYIKKKNSECEHYQSSYELERMIFLDGRDDVITWTKNHLITIPYFWEDGSEHVYKPDFLVQWKDGSVTLEEVKGYVKDQNILTAKNMAAVSYCEDHDMMFKLLNKNDLQHRDRQHVFFLEGPDNCGKSHIGRSLEFLIDIPYFRFSKQHEYWTNESFKLALEYDQPMLESLIRQLHCDVLIDRCYISEWVYSSVFKRKTNEKLLNKLDLRFSRLGCVAMIFLRRSYDGHDNDVVVSKDKFLELHKKYLEFVKWTRCKCIVMHVDDYDNDTLKQCPVLMSAIDEIVLSDASKKVIEL